MTAAELLGEARVAVGRGEWQRAIELLDAAGDAARTAEGWELRAQAAYGNGELEAAVTAWEQLHALCVADGEQVAAARAAAMIAMYLMMDTGLMAPVRGWVRRAERLLAGRVDTPAHAIVAMVRTYERFMCGDMDEARRQAERAIDLGDRLGVGPAVVIGRVAAARITIFDGHLDEGLEQLDEIGALLMTGEVDPLTTGMMYCELICAAQGLTLYDRAREWTEVMEHWRHGAAFGGINGRCRVHRAEMFRTSGPCDVAEREALLACEELRPWMRREFGWPLAELGTIRLRRGDLAGAEEAFTAAYAHVWSPHPGLALLRLEQGDAEAAAALIAEAIAHPFDIPSKERPPFGDLRLAPLLDAQVQIAAARGDARIAGDAAAALAAIAARYPSRALVAAADLARARAALVAGDDEGSIAAATAAAAGWSELGAPFETASARMVIGEGHSRRGSLDAARVEWAAARQAFGEFGAVSWARRAERLLEGDARDAAPVAAAPRIPVEPATFTCAGETRTVCFGGTTISMRDLKGFRYLARLLADPGREFHVLDLVGTDASGVAAGMPVLDDAAREAYRRRLADIDEDIEDAERMHDVGRLELAQADRQYLVAELARAVGLGGRLRSVGGTAERARTSVTRSLRYALERLAEHHPHLAAHLDQCVHTGTYCRYSPDPLAPIDWQT